MNCEPCEIAEVMLKKPEIKTPSIPSKMLKSYLEEAIKEYNITYKQILSKTRRKKVLYLRHGCCYLFRKYTTKTLKEIAELVGNENHSTTFNSLKVVMHCKNGFNDELFEIVNNLEEIVLTLHNDSKNGYI